MTPDKRSIKRPLITIITATYNAESTLPDLIKSIESQTNSDFEFIIIDGASTDKTLDIIKAHSEYIDLWISEKDSGIYDAWNKGIKLAHGNWLAFIGADDRLKPNAIQLYSDEIKKLEDTSINFISAKAEVINNSGDIINIIGDRFHPTFIDVCHVMALHKSSLFHERGLYDIKYKIVGDYEFLLRCKNCIKPFFLDKVIAEIGNGGVSTSYRAIREIYFARVNSGSVNSLVAKMLFMWNVFTFYLNICFHRHS